MSNKSTNKNLTKIQKNNNLILIIKLKTINKIIKIINNLAQSKIKMQQQIIELQFQKNK